MLNTFNRSIMRENFLLVTSHARAAATLPPPIKWEGGKTTLQRLVYMSLLVVRRMPSAASPSPSGMNLHDVMQSA